MVTSFYPLPNIVLNPDNISWRKFQFSYLWKQREIDFQLFLYKVWKQWKKWKSKGIIVVLLILSLLSVYWFHHISTLLFFCYIQECISKCSVLGITFSIDALSLHQIIPYCDFFFLTACSLGIIHFSEEDINNKNKIETTIKLFYSFLVLGLLTYIGLSLGDLSNSLLQSDYKGSLCTVLLLQNCLVGGSYLFFFAKKKMDTFQAIENEIELRKGLK